MPEMDALPLALDTAEVRFRLGISGGLSPSTASTETSSSLHRQAYAPMGAGSDQGEESGGGGGKPCESLSTPLVRCSAKSLHIHVEADTALLLLGSANYYTNLATRIAAAAAPLLVTRAAAAGPSSLAGKEGVVEATAGQEQRAADPGPDPILELDLTDVRCSGIVGPKDLVTVQVIPICIHIVFVCPFHSVWTTSCAQCMPPSILLAVSLPTGQQAEVQQPPCRGCSGRIPTVGQWSSDLCGPLHVHPASAAV